MNITKAAYDDLDQIMTIVDEAKAFLKEHNINQWQNGYPNIDIFKEDIDKSRLYVVKKGNRVLAVFALVNYESDYDQIYDGYWKDDSPYIAIHRIAVANSYKGKGVAKFIFDNLKKNYRHIRVDTHKLNMNMQHCLIKNGFEYRGVIYLKGIKNDENYRFAYEFYE